ncbi:MAG: phosphate ABC transporter permease subunit PstC [Actinomycetia bacterium]|nr:phosphate ABC transporter permease subunit PstC [Actinomycetes bacterium]MCH9801284.1 phosphate ABC transporter permease subunit PstC [Actinomycetes bacterium]
MSTTTDQDPDDVLLRQTGRTGDRVIGFLASGSGILVIATVVAVGVFLLWQAIPSILADQVPFLTSREWNVQNPDDLRFGILDLAWTTILSSVMAMVIAVPIAIGIAIFITQYAPRQIAKPIASLVDLLAAVPSIVYGLWGIQVFAPAMKPFGDWLSETVGWFPLFAPGLTSPGTVYSIGLVLAIMILPIITAISREVYDQTPLLHKEAALALGATKWEMVRTTVLPFGRPGVISASMLGLGRALGETMAVVIILSKPAPGSEFNPSIFAGGETFASKIANNAAEFDSPEKTGAYIAAGLVLFVMTFIVNAIARSIIAKRKDFTE